MPGRAQFRSLKLALAVLTISVAVAPAQAAAQIVANGDFESPVVSGNFEAFFPPGFDSWNVEEGSVDIVRELWTPASGAQSLDLNGPCCDPGTISQVLDTIPGTTYDLSFAFAGNPDPDPVCLGSPVKTMAVSWGDASLGTFSFDTTGHTLADPGWETIVVPVTATGTTALLVFRSLVSGAGGACGPIIDAVSVTDSPADRRGLGCGDKNHVHEREDACRKTPR